MSTIIAIYKWLLSYGKSEWGIDDYPLRYRKQGKDQSDIPRWCVQIVNWWVMAGLGDTPEAAKGDLEANLNMRLAEDGHVPRPGTRVPITLASSTEIDLYWDVLSRIVEEVLGHDPDRTFLSDRSSLWYFVEDDDSISEYLEQISRTFGVDVSDIESGSLLEIGKRIRNAT